MRILVRGTKPKKPDWFYKVKIVCPHCDPATVYMIEQEDLEIQGGVHKPSATSFTPSHDREMVVTLCPVCCNEVVTKKEGA